MSKIGKFVKIFKQKTRARKGLIRGSYTALDIERSKGLSSLSSVKVVKSKLAAGIDKSKLIPETPEFESDIMVFYQTWSGKFDDQKLVEEPSCTNIQKGVDLKSDLPVVKESVIIPETPPLSDDAMDRSSQEEEEEFNKNLKDRSLINLQKEFEIAPEIIPDSDSDSDKITMATDRDFLSDIIPSTYDTHKRECGVGGKTKVFKKNKESLAADFKMSQPQMIKRPVLAHADAKVLCTNNVSLKNNIEAELKELKYRPKKKEEQKLAVLCVKMRYEVLPQHTVEGTAGTRTMRLNERAMFHKYAVLRKGSFDEAEDGKIKENWKTFCQDNDWDPQKPEPFLLMKHDGNKKFLMHNLENRKRFVRCLAHGLPDRCLYSVYNRFKNLYGDSSKKTSKYTVAEDSVILEHLSDYTDHKESNRDERQFADLAIVLKRTRASVWRRYRLLKKKLAQTEMVKGQSVDGARGPPRTERSFC